MTCGYSKCVACSRALTGTSVSTESLIWCQFMTDACIQNVWLIFPQMECYEAMRNSPSHRGLDHFNESYVKMMQICRDAGSTHPDPGKGTTGKRMPIGADTRHDLLRTAWGRCQRRSLRRHRRACRVQDIAREAASTAHGCCDPGHGPWPGICAGGRRGTPYASKQ